MDQIKEKTLVEEATLLADVSEEFLSTTCNELLPGDVEFSVITNGYCEALRVDAFYLAGENSEREWDEEKDDYARTQAQDIARKIRLFAESLEAVANEYERRSR